MSAMSRFLEDQQAIANGESVQAYVHVAALRGIAHVRSGLTETIMNMARASAKARQNDGNSLIITTKDYRDAISALLQDSAAHDIALHYFDQQ